jgi:hypothetical protein
MSILINVVLCISAIVGLGLFVHACSRGKQVLKKLSQKKLS